MLQGIFYFCGTQLKTKNYEDQAMIMGKIILLVIDITKKEGYSDLIKNLKTVWNSQKQNFISQFNFENEEEIYVIDRAINEFIGIGI